MEEKRARRIRDKLRMKAKAKRLYPHDGRASHMANHLAVCSCEICRNPRRAGYGNGKDRLTIQERRVLTVSR